MVEILPLSPAYPVMKAGKTKKDNHLPEPPKRKKKQVMEEQEILPVQHFDELA
jgi:hypothetical protein